MGYGGGFGGEADTGGVGGGGSSGAGSNGDGGGRASGNGGMGSSNASGGANGAGGGGYGGAVGHGVDSAHGGTSSVGADGGVSGLGGYAGAADAAEEAFGGWQTESDTQMGPENTAYGANTPSNYGGTLGDNLAASPISMEEATSRAQQSIASNAKPGLIGSMMTAGLTAIGQPALGYAANSMARGYNAQQSAKSHNTEFGTSVDEGLATNVGQQAVGALSGTLGAKVGGRFGAKAGASIGGVPGAIAGGLIGSMTAGNAARGAAMSSGNGPTGPAGPSESPGGNERDNANLTSATDIARARRQAEINEQADQATMPVSSGGNQAYGYQPQSQGNYQFASLADAATNVFG